MSEDDFLTEIGQIISLRCRILYKTYNFWLSSIICILAEPILCVYSYNNISLIIQKIIIAFSAILFFIEIIGHITSIDVWDNVIVIDEEINNYKFFKRILLKILGTGNYVLEGLCIIGGALSISTNPGIAALRCFRVFRLLWLYEVEIFRDTIKDHLLYLKFTEDFVQRIFELQKFGIKSLKELFGELTLTNRKGRGGVLLLFSFFYISFVISLMLYIEIDSPTSLFEWWYIMIRYSLFDGLGFDTVYQISKNHIFIFVLLIIYLIVNSFALMNAIMIVFGKAFTEKENTLVNGHVVSRTQYNDISKLSMANTTTNLIHEVSANINPNEEMTTKDTLAQILLEIKNISERLNQLQNSST